MVVTMFHVTVPEAGREGFERSWRGRAGLVDQMPGFRGLEVLRSQGGDGRYVVLMHWETREDFDHWQESSQFGQAHAHTPQGPGAAQPIASEVWDILDTGKAQS